MSMSTLAFQNFQESSRMAARSRVAMVTPQSSEPQVTPQATTTEVPAVLEQGMECINLDDDRHTCIMTSDKFSIGGSSSVRKDGKESSQEPKLPVPSVQGFLLVDDSEALQVKSAGDFLEKLNCSEEENVKVVSIFGNTGDGKSYTLNHTFYNNQEIFKTSPSQDSCTIGVWAAYDPNLKVITVDTEGLLGTTTHQNQRTRLLLKVLALSDIIIYRTKAERLHNDLFKFLGDASDAYEKHFAKALQRAVLERWNTDVSFTTLGPAVIVFHETANTVPLGFSGKKTPETLLKERFKHEGKHINAFNSLHYVGIKTQDTKTDFRGLQKVIKQQIENTAVRSPRSPLIIYQALKVLNEKFNGKIEEVVAHTFPDEYFTCSAKCLSCNNRCSLTMNHLKDKVGHDTVGKCQYQHQYENKVYICEKCNDNGQTTLVVPKTSASSDSTWFGLAKYAWSGYVLECPTCGIIYRSREYWYGNRDPVDSAVRTEIRHVWPGGNPVLQGTHNAARKLLDGLSHVAGSVGYVSARPTKMLSDWMTDRIAPAYWIPNSEINECFKCKISFDKPGETKHHCRACGQGFCDNCSTHRRPVPERGWGATPVRVCDKCFKDDKGDVDIEKEARDSGNEGDGDQVTARKMGEVMASTFGVVASALEYPKGLVVDAARPAYWKPDNEIKKCCCCQQDFGPKLTIHHCRACGDGVCDECSQNREPVPSRGWDHPVRVCNNCHDIDDLEFS
ncbi:zinc finger FYVE domain-containing protein 1-like isoform X2 [Glandiceps talaboti]